MNFAEQRERMVERQLVKRGIKDLKVLSAMRTIPREEFVPDEFRTHAYTDEPIPIGLAQTISQPYMVALMAQCLLLSGDECVLEVGCGSGYAAAVLSTLAAEVITIEMLPELAERAKEALRRTGFSTNVLVVRGDGSMGYPAKAPYRAITVAAGAPEAPQALLDQLDEGGRLVIPIGPHKHQELRLIGKTQGRIESRIVTGCSFVPLNGEQGWK